MGPGENDTVKQMNFSDDPARCRLDLRYKHKKGQAILEYSLLVVFVVLIFAYTFSVIRRSLFNVWVCQFYPRIASLDGCSPTDTSGCWQNIIKAGGTAFDACNQVQK